jgi:hypothetical protein
VEVQPYLDRRPDYSREFTERVALLAERVAVAVGVPVTHQTDMNYSVGQQIRIYLTEDGSPVPDEQAATSALSVAVSSKGPLYTLLAWHRRQHPPTWLPTPPTEVLVAPRAKAVVEAVDTIMAAASMGHVPEEMLDQPVPGHVTDMDGAPATVRDVLFCEIC